MASSRLSSMDITGRDTRAATWPEQDQISRGTRALSRSLPTANAGFDAQSSAWREDVQSMGGNDTSCRRSGTSCRLSSEAGVDYDAQACSRQERGSSVGYSGSVHDRRLCSGTGYDAQACSQRSRGPTSGRVEADVGYEVRPSSPEERNSSRGRSGTSNRLSSEAGADYDAQACSRQERGSSVGYSGSVHERRLCSGTGYDAQACSQRSRGQASGRVEADVGYEVRPSSPEERSSSRGRSGTSCRLSSEAGVDYDAQACSRQERGSSVGYSGSVHERQLCSGTGYDAQACSQRSRGPTSGRVEVDVGYEVRPSSPEERNSSRVRSVTSCRLSSEAVADCDAQACSRRESSVRNGISSGRSFEEDDVYEAQDRWPRRDQVSGRSGASCAHSFDASADYETQQSSARVCDEVPGRSRISSGRPSAVAAVDERNRISSGRLSAQAAVYDANPSSRGERDEVLGRSGAPCARSSAAAADRVSSGRLSAVAAVYDANPSSRGERDEVSGHSEAPRGRSSAAAADRDAGAISFQGREELPERNRPSSVRFLESRSVSPEAVDHDGEACTWRDEDQLSIMTLNLQHFASYPKDEVAARQRLSAVSGGDCPADVICVQEGLASRDVLGPIGFDLNACSGRAGVAETVSEMVYNSSAALQVCDPALHRELSCNQIYVRRGSPWRVVGKGVVKINSDLELDGGNGRVQGQLVVRSMVWVRLRLAARRDGPSVYVMCTHITGGRFEDQYFLQRLSKERKCQMERIVSFYNERPNPDSSDVGLIVGDLNATPEYTNDGPMQRYFERAVQESPGVLADAALRVGAKADLSELFRKYMNSPFAALRSLGWGFAYGQEIGATSWFGHVVDHMALSRPLSTVSVEVGFLTNQKFGDRPRDTDCPISDHNSVKAVFQLRCPVLTPGVRVKVNSKTAGGWTFGKVVEPVKPGVVSVEFPVKGSIARKNLHVHSKNVALLLSSTAHSQDLTP